MDARPRSTDGQARAADPDGAAFDPLSFVGPEPVSAAAGGRLSGGAARRRAVEVHASSA